MILPDVAPPRMVEDAEEAAVAVPAPVVVPPSPPPGLVVLSADGADVCSVDERCW